MVAEQQRWFTHKQQDIFKGMLWCKTITGLQLHQTIIIHNTDTVIVIIEQFHKIGYVWTHFEH